MVLQIRRERERRGWTQEDVGREIGIEKSTLSHIEKGDRKPSYEVMVKLEDLFEMTHRELLAPIDDEIIPQRGVGSKERK